jgi:hypothetical protein
MLTRLKITISIINTIVSSSLNYAFSKCDLLTRSHYIMNGVVSTTQVEDLHGAVEIETNLFSTDAGPCTDACFGTKSYVEYAIFNFYYVLGLGGYRKTYQ